MASLRLRDVFQIVPPVYWPVVMISLVLLIANIRAAMAAGHEYGRVWISPHGWLRLEILDPPADETPRPSPNARALALALAGEIPVSWPQEAPVPSQGARPSGRPASRAPRPVANAPP